MNNKSFGERGSIMVEVIAVLALLGTMSALIFRQVQQRNEDVANINMASEIRMVKEATIAYIQANRAALETRCKLEGANDTDEWQLNRQDVEAFLPENWAADHWSGDNCDGIICDYDIWATCYLVNPTIAPRKAIYGTIIPTAKAASDWDLSLRRISKIAGLIGSDGGVFDPFLEGDGEDKRLHGTMGAWEVNCPNNSCNDRHDAVFVATTGMDIYIPEAEQDAANTVSVPHNIAFEELHSTRYFSVGEGTNCVGNYNSGTGFAHETLDPNTNIAPDDEIRRVGEGPDGNKCDPLFWVGTHGSDSTVDKSKSGEVYIKNSLYIGRDNAGNKQAVAIETSSTDNTGRKITVYDMDGKDRLTLDGTGKVIGRSNGSTGYFLDAKSGEIVLFREATIPWNEGEQTVQIPTLRLKDGVMDTGKEAPYNVGTYRVDPAYTSVMNDMILTSRGGAKLSDILSDYITKGIYSISQSDNTAQPVPKPTFCPTGYVRAIMVTPVSWSQYVKSFSVELNGGTGDVIYGSPESSNHGHSIIASGSADATGESHEIDINPGYMRLQLQQQKPVQIQIDEGTCSGTGCVPPWNVSLTYGGDAPSNNDTISAIAQTFCVFDAKNFSGYDGDKNKSAGIGTGADFYRQEEGSENSAIPTANRSCSHDYDCSNTESCSEGKCTPYGTCTGAEGSLNEGYYCINHQKTKIECIQDSDCSGSKQCISYRCK